MVVTPARILVVEDEVIVAESIRETLESFGYEVSDIATTSEEALQAMERTSPDLVLMDIKLRGDVDGITTAERIRAQFGPPVIYLTAYADDETLQRAKITAPFGYLVKPFDARDLNLTIEMALYKHQMEQRLRVSEEHYRALFEGMPVGLYQQTSDGRVLAANPALVEMLGYPDLETLLRTGASEFYVNAEDRTHWRNILEQEDVLHNFEVQMRRYDKREIWVLENTRAVRDDEGTLLYYEGSLEDITSRKWAEDALRQRTRELDWLNSAGQKFSSTLDLDQVLAIVIVEIRQLLEASAASIWLLDPDTNQLSYPQHTSVVEADEALSPKSGVAGWVARRGQSLIVPDVWELEQDGIGGDMPVDERDEEPATSVRSILSVPLRARERVIGVIQLLSTEVNHFSYAELALVEALAASAGIAIENARLYKDMDKLFNLTQTALDQTESLYHVSRAMSSLKNLEDLLRVVVDGVAEALPADQALLVTLDAKACQGQLGDQYWLEDNETRAEYEWCMVAGGTETLIEDWASFEDLSDSFIAWVMREEEPVLVFKHQSAPWERSAEIKTQFPDASKVGAMLLVPLAYQGEVFGVLAAFNRPDHPDFSQQDLELLVAMSNHVATAIENARLVGSLREQRDFAESLVETAQAIILLLDEEGRIIRFNPYMEALSGYRLEEVRGQDWFTTFLPKRDQTRIRELFLRSIDGVQTQGSINCILTKDGEERYIEWYDQILEDAEGALTGLLAIGHDITERLRVEEALQDSEARYRAISELTSDYAYAFRVEPEGTLTLEWVTDAFAHITGYTLEEAQHPDLWEDLIYPEDKAVAQQRAYSLFKGETDVREFRIVTKQGQVRWLLDHAHPIWDEVQKRVVRIIGAARDITQRKRSALALARQLEAARAFSSTLDYDEVLSQVARYLTEAVGVTHCTFLRWNAETQTIVVWRNWIREDMNAVAPADGVRPDTVYEIGTFPVFRRVLNDQTPYVLRADEGDGELSEAERAYLRAFNTDSLLILPFTLADRVIGLAQLFDPDAEKSFSAMEMENTEAMANQAAAAIENVRLYEAVRQQRQQLRTLTARLTESEGAERQGLAQELHDQVGQNLTALGVSLNIIRTLLPESLEAMREETENLVVVRSRLDEAIAILEQTADRVREVMANLRSPVLEDYGLVSALRWYGALFTERTGIEVLVEGEDPTPRLVVSAENALFQVAQDALTNVAEHTEATRAWVTLELEPQTIRLTITDDGVEFDPERLERVGGPQGAGLVSITERAEMIGGRCRVEPAPEGGTRVVIEVQR